MNKKDEALKKLAELEKETKELRRIIEEPEDLKKIIKPTWEEVCKYVRRDPKELPFRNPLLKLEKHSNADFKINIISELFNEGVILNWLDRNQPKYYILFERKASGWVVGVVLDDRYVATAGSGFYFKDRETAQFVADNFMDIFLDYLPD